MACSLRVFCWNLPKGLGPTLNMTPKRIESEHSEIEQVMLPLLRGRVFHVTTEEKFNDICRCGWIYSKEQTKFVFAPGQSETTYGRKRGWVSLYDLSNTEDTDIKEALIRYWFFRTLRAGSRYVYLIIAESAWSSLVSWKRASRDVGEQELFIPFVEAWYPGDIPLQLVSESLVLTVHPPSR